MKRQLSQQEINNVFQGTDAVREVKSAIVPFDFSRSGRIPKSQIRAVHLLHENFSRNLSSSLSAYLRGYVSINRVSLEQIAYSDFLEGLSSPTFIAYIGLRPYDGTAVLELSPVLVATFVEMLLGGKGKSAVNTPRKATEIENHLMQNLLRVLLRDLNDAWKSVADIEFTVQSLASEPHGLHVLAPAEAIIAIAIEVRAGSTAGMINFAIPSIFIKRLRHMFERLGRVHRVQSKRRDQVHMAELLGKACLDLEVRFDGPTISTRNLLALKVGDVLMMDYTVDRKATAFLNGIPKFSGDIAMAGPKLGFKIASQHDQND